MHMHKLARTKLTLAKKVATLRTLLAQNASETKLLKAATKVRDARVQVLRATIGEMPFPFRTPRQNKRIAKIEGQIDSLRATEPLVILAEFRQAKPKASSP